MLTNKDVAARLLAQEDIGLVCHRSPDGDTLGSAMALFHALSSLGKRVRVDCVDPIPRNLQFLAADFPEFIPSYRVAVDVAAPSMLGDPKENRPHIDLCIDHHATNEGYADETRLVNYAATGEVIYEIILELGAKISPTIATALYTALFTDTGGFRYANTTAQTLRYAAELMEAGADYNLIREQIYESKLRGQVQAEAEVLSHVHYYRNGQIAVITVSLDLLARTGVEEDELEGLSSLPLQIDGVDIGITLKERSDGSVRVSMRSSAAADVSVICREFEGGGHVRASGCRIWDSLAGAEQKLIAACEKGFF